MSVVSAKRFAKQKQNASGNVTRHFGRGSPTMTDNSAKLAFVLERLRYLLMTEL